MNPLPLFQIFFETFDGVQGRFAFKEIPRWQLRQWLETTDWYQANCSGRGTTDLALDCLAAAGIGREQEQTATVYCRASNLDVE